MGDRKQPTPAPVSRVKPPAPPPPPASFPCPMCQRGQGCRSKVGGSAVTHGHQQPGDDHLVGLPCYLEGCAVHFPRNEARPADEGEIEEDWIDTAPLIPPRSGPVQVSVDSIEELKFHSTEPGRRRWCPVCGQGIGGT